MKNCKLFLVLIFIAFCIACDQPTIGKDDDNDETVETELIPLDRDPVIAEGFTPYETGSGYLYRMVFTPQYHEQRIDKNIWMIHQPLIKGAYGMGGDNLVFATSENLSDSGITICSGSSYFKTESKIEYSSGFGWGPMHWLLTDLHIMPESSLNYKWDRRFQDHEQESPTEVSFKIVKVDSKILTANVDVINYDGFTGTGTAIYDTDVGLVSFKGYNEENKLEVLYELKEAKMFEKTTVSGTVTFNNQTVEDYNVSPYNVPTVATDANGDYTFDLYADDIRLYHGGLLLDGYFDHDKIYTTNISNVGETVVHNIILEEAPPPEPELTPENPTPVIQNGFTPLETGSGYLYRMALLPDQNYGYLADDTIWVIHQPTLTSLPDYYDPMLAFFISENIVDNGSKTYRGISYTEESTVLRRSSGFGDNGSGSDLLLHLSSIPKGTVNSEWTSSGLDFKIIESQEKIITVTVTITNYDGFTGTGTAIYNTDVGLISFKGYDSDNKLAVLFELKEAKTFEKTTVSGTVTFEGNPVADYNVSPFQIASETTDLDGNYSFDIYTGDLRIYHGSVDEDESFYDNQVPFKIFSNVGETITHDIILEEEYVPPPEQEFEIIPENPAPIIENGFMPYETGSGYLYRMAVLPDYYYGTFADDNIWVIHQQTLDSLPDYFPSQFVFFTSENVRDEGLITYRGHTFSKDQTGLIGSGGFGSNGAGSGLLLQLSRVPNAEVNSGWNYEYEDSNNPLTKLVFTVTDVQNKNITASFEVINFDNFTGSGIAIYNTDVGLISFKGYDSENRLAVLFELKEAKMFEKTTVSGTVTKSGNPVSNYNVSPFQIATEKTDVNGDYSFDIYADDLIIYHGSVDEHGGFYDNQVTVETFSNIGTSIVHDIEL